MNNTSPEIDLTVTAGAAAVIVAAAQILKTMGLPSRWVPLAALALSAVFTIPAGLAAGQPWWQAAANSIIAAAAACGAWSGVKNSLQKTEPETPKKENNEGNTSENA